MAIFTLLSGPLGWVLKMIYGVVNNYGIAIILFTVLVRMASMPLQMYQQKSTAKMAVFQPMIQDIQTRYKNDQEKQNQEMMKLQQEYGYNPMSGCLPMILNMLVLFGVMYAIYYPMQYILGVPADVIANLSESFSLTNRITAQTSLIQMAHDGVALPGLTDAQYAAAANFNMNFFGIDLGSMPVIGINVGIMLPVLACLTMVISNLIMMAASGQSSMKGSGSAMIWFSSAFFAWFCFTVPLGFSLYYCVSNVIMLGQTAISKKIYDPEKMKAQAEAEMAAKKKAAKNAKRAATMTVTDSNGKQKTLSGGEVAKARLEMARKLDEEKYAGERTERL